MKGKSLDDSTDVNGIGPINIYSDLGVRVCRIPKSYI